MDFRILGPVEVFGDVGEPVMLAQRLQRRLVAELLLHARKPRSRPDLIAALWGDSPPSGNGGSALRSLVHATRGALGQYAARLETWPAGYAFLARDDENDLAAFRDLAGRGQAALDAGDTTSAAYLLTEALRLWRQPPLADLPPTATRARLLDQFRTIRADLIDAQLALGQHRSVLPDLRAMVAEDPLHEHSWAQLMTALYCGGSRAAALGCYRDIRKALALGHGIDPGPELRDLHARILRDDPGLLTQVSAPGPAWTWVPLRQLPAPLPDFTGRRAETMALLSRLSAARQVVVLHGMAGQGCTALAVRAAQLAVPSFPDGQIWVELGGCTDPRDPQDVLGQLIVWALGHPAPSLPPAGPEREALYRSLLAGRRVLLVADGAMSADQVRPLLPGTAGSCVLVTTRGRLRLDGAAVQELTGMRSADAVKLLAVTAGHDRVEADLRSAESIVTSCGFLPLAIRIAGWQLAAGELVTLSELAGALADPDRRLAVLTFADESVTARLHASAVHLDPAARAALGTLASDSVDGANMPATILSALLGPHARSTAASLVDVGLLTETRGDAGSTIYHLHPLVRAFAAELAGAQARWQARGPRLRRSAVS
ncbi:MAG: BTAD domain-containing putative transcriptional regulator [Streptosporangiaceae bacterium]